MRLTKLWTFPVTVLLLTACSSETLTDSTTTPTGDDAVSFARLNVNLPSVPTTRAYTADPGDNDEFKVTDTRIFLFQGTQGTSEDNYTFLYEAEPTEWISPFDNSAKDDEYQGAESFIIKLQGANKVYKDLYALVVLNGDNIPAPTTAGQTFDSYNAAVSLATEGNTARYLGDTNKGFVMANAANAANAGTDADPTVLVPLTLYNSPDAAKESSGNNIYVERNAVKVTVRSDNTSYKLKSDNAVTVEPLAWTLTNTNLTMYPFHKVTGLRTGGTNSYKNIWFTKASDGSTVASRFLGPAFDGFRRTHWSMDPNYSTDLNTKEACAAEFHVATEADDVTEPFSTPATETMKAVYNPLYCAENTFDIAHMMKGQTTAVIVKAKITHTSDDVAANEDAVAAKPRLATRATTPANNVFGVQGHVWSEGYLAQLVAKTASTAFGTTVTTDNVDLSSLLRKEKATLTADNFTRLTKNGAAFTPTAAQLKDLNIEIGPITGYEGGICYYIAYIRHFGDETPWHSGDATYGDDNEKWLGRYGVVRNNWYDLTIQDFAYPGSPKIPTPKPEDPDDDHSVILLNVKVNPWAKEDTKFVPLE